MEPRYVIEGDRVLYRHSLAAEVLQGAHAATFVQVHDETAPPGLHPLVGHDQHVVWYAATRVDGADPATFRFFVGDTCDWGCDAAHVYCFVEGRRLGTRVIAVDAKDAATLRFPQCPAAGVARGYMLTDSRVFWEGCAVRGADPATFENLPLDVIGGVRRASSLYRDRAAVYCCGKVMKGVDRDLSVFAVDSNDEELCIYVVDGATNVYQVVPFKPFLARLTLDELNAPEHVLAVEALRTRLQRAV
jgi:hypothetical protein